LSKMIERSDGSWLTGNEILPKHQHKIILSLAKYGAMNMSQTNRKIQGQNTSTTRAFHELKKKKLITETVVRNYHGRQFPEYWLTGRGLAYVFLNCPVLFHDKYTTTEKEENVKEKDNSNSKTENFLNSGAIYNYASLYLKDKTIDTYLELRSVSESLADFLDHSMFRFGNLKFQEMASYLIMTIDLIGDSEAFKFLEVTKLPEEFYAILKNNLEKTKKFLVMLEKIREK
jgi:hypothetical protein